MIIGIIPARYASSRFPGKSLADIHGKSMIQHVYERSAKSKALHKLVVATDDARIYDHVLAFGGEAVMTQAHHPSGTDRCYDALQQVAGDFTYIINIQGDEPLIDPAQIDELATALQDGTTELATQMIPVHDHELLFDKGEVKIVLNHNMEALYFSRMVIPFIKGVPETDWHLHHNYYRHVGMYAYRRDILEQITTLSVSPLEQAESLEQLRWLEAGFKIRCIPTAFESHCVDTPEDLAKIIKMVGQ